MMVNKKNWKEFRETGLLLIINQVLHVFGWAIVVEVYDGEVRSVYPARVKFRGFDQNSTTDAYKKATKYLKDNINDLEKEAED